MLTNKKQTGFTIVELLIVIIVIAILATLVITAYNGVQAKARNTQRVAAAKDWQKIIITYVTTYGKYPPGVIVGVHGTIGVCLGSGYPTDWDDDPNEDCVATTNVKHPNTAWNNALRNVASVFPDFNKTPIDGGSGMLLLGIFVRTGTVDGVSTYPELYYYLEGTGQSCGLSPVIAGGMTGTSAINSGDVGSTATVCQIKLPDPASL